MKKGTSHDIADRLMLSATFYPCLTTAQGHGSYRLLNFVDKYDFGV